MKPDEGKEKRWEGEKETLVL